MSLLRLGHRRRWAETLCLGSVALEEASCHVLKPLRQPCGGRPTKGGMETFSQHPCGCAILEMNPPAPVQPLDDCSPGQQLGYNPLGDPKLEPQSEVTPEFLALRNCLLFQLLLCSNILVIQFHILNTLKSCCLDNCLNVKLIFSTRF